MARIAKELCLLTSDLLHFFILFFVFVHRSLKRNYLGLSGRSGVQI
jgi:hypothetical protein